MKNITISAAEIAELVNGEVVGDGSRVITGVAGIRHATENELSFVGSKRYEKQLEAAKAGIILVCKELAKERENQTLIACESVDYAFAKIVNMFAEEPPVWEIGIHPSAVVSPSAKIGKNVSINANAVVEAGAEIGDNAVIGAGCYIGHDAKVGADTLLYPNVTIMFRCIVGEKCIFHPGVVIGGDGFGFVPGPKGLVKVPQTGIVRIGNDVEIGANTTVDRARFGETQIKDNVKIDNHVMVAHNVVVGESSILIAQCGIAGSTELGKGVILAAKAGIGGHVIIGDGTQIAGTSNVIKDTAPGSVLIGTPAETQREFMARVGLPKKVERLNSKIEELTARLAALEANKAE